MANSNGLVDRARYRWVSQKFDVQIDEDQKVARRVAVVSVRLFSVRRRALIDHRTHCFIAQFALFDQILIFFLIKSSQNFMKRKT